MYNQNSFSNLHLLILPFLMKCVQGTINYEQIGALLTRLGAFLPVFYLICNIGESITGTFEDFHEVIFGMEWHSCPIELQKYLVIMLAITQQPVIMQGIFSLDCSRITFKRVN